MMLPLHEIEKEYIKKILEKMGGNKYQAAHVLGIDRKTRYRKLARSKKAFGKTKPYPEQDSEELDYGVVARFNPQTHDLENLEILFFSSRVAKGETFTLLIAGRFMTILAMSHDSWREAYEIL